MNRPTVKNIFIDPRATEDRSTDLNRIAGCIRHIATFPDVRDCDEVKPLEHFGGFFIYETRDRSTAFKGEVVVFALNQDETAITVVLFGTTEHFISRLRSRIYWPSEEEAILWEEADEPIAVS